MGLINRVVDDGSAREAAERLAFEIARFPQACMKSDRLSAYEQMGQTLETALANEFRHGLAVIQSGESREGASRFASGSGRHGKFDS
jgi:enoyl-CoA hydratase